MLAHSQLPTFKQQRGVVLAVSLIMLLLITTLAVSGMQASTMEERMASNSRNSNIAFQLAETALRQGESVIESSSNSKSISKAAELKVFSDTEGSIPAYGADCFIELGSKDFSKPSTWDSACNYIGEADDVADKSAQFFIEYVFAQNKADDDGYERQECVYQITARGYGADANSYTTLQSTYKFSSCS